MKKLHAFALSMLLAPVITLGSSAVLAQQSAAQPNPTLNQANQQQSGSAQGNQTTMRTGESRMERRGYMDSTPMNGMRISDLMGADVKTTNDEDLGSVTDVIVDESGSIIALVVGVGGFLGMGERDVAIGWDDVTKSRTGDNHELRVSVTRDSLSAAPEFRRDN
jgi:sporulation protein YlmC with PRC-barrel domain